MMARGGINRAVVKIARDRLLARGLKPTIDAIRIELGNTGSKSTIIRCLRELDHVEPQLQPPSLEEELCTLIGSVAERMREDAQASVASERELLTRQQMDYRIQRQQSLEKINELQSSNADLSAALKTHRSLELELQERLRESEIERSRLFAVEQASRQLLEASALQLRSIEEKYAHSRQSLEHYRTLQKQQREQEVNRHEQKISQLGHEMRVLQDSLIKKHDELIKLNRENERLVQEAKNLRNQVISWEKELRNQRASFSEDSLSLKAEQQRLRQELESAQAENVILRERLRQRLLKLRHAQRLNQKIKNI